MPICIECSYPVSHLYSTYSRADDRSLGKGVRLTQCPRCKRFADKYVEYDFVVLFIDLVLIKPQVYRHLLFNRLGRDDNQFDRSIVRLGILLLLFDVYLTWARIEKSPSLATTFLSRAPIIIQYLFFLSLNALATLAHHSTVRLLASVIASKPRHPFPLENGTAGTGENTPLPSNPSTPVLPSFSSSSPSTSVNNAAAGSSPPKSTTAGQENHGSGTAGCQLPPPATTPLGSPTGGVPGPALRRSSTAMTLNQTTVHPLPPPTPASPTAISTALLVSSCAKLFPILLVIWGPDGSGGIGVSENATGAATPQPIPTATGTAASILFHKATAPMSSISGALFTTDVAAGAGEAAGSAAASFFEPWIARLAASWSNSIVQGIVSLLSVGAADTHLVLLNNIEALYILLGCGYLRAVSLAVAGQVARWVVQRVVLGMVGVG